MKKTTTSIKEACSFTDDPSHYSPLKIMMAKEFMKKMTTTTTINP
jgi:hypothetical protein